MKKPPVRVHHKMLSHWQSLVRETAMQTFSDKPDLIQKIIDANDAFAEQADKTPNYPFIDKPILGHNFPQSDIPFEHLPHENLAALLEHGFLKTFLKEEKTEKPEGADDQAAQQGEANQHEGVYSTKQHQAASTDGYPDRPYSDEAWVKFTADTIANYEYSYRLRHPTGKDYVSAKGKNTSTFGVIPWQIPQGSKVAIIGDWGTGMSDAKALLNDIVKNHAPAAIIHLGDVYYSGTTTECRENFTDIITQVYTDNNVNIPFFTIPGNHEYYSFGYPYFAMLPGLNANLGSSYLQEASFFCLRVANSQWQFLAMDTGYNDADPFDAKNPTAQGPKVQSSEIDWHKDKLKNFNGATILLSHHQLFSANARINGRTSWDGMFHSEYKNMGLHDTFQPYFKDKIAAWIWGHEHNFALYQNNLDGLAKGRLIGCSAYQESHGLNPYQVNCSDFPFLSPTQYQVTAQYGYYNHAYGILDFSGVSSANDSVVATYYQFPSWDDTQSYEIPTNPAATYIYSENITRPQALAQPAVQYGDLIKLVSSNSFLSGANGSETALLENFPSNLKITGHSGSIKDSDTVYIQNISPLLGANNYLTANGHSSNLTYGPQSSNAIWYIKKNNNEISASDTTIRYGDDVHFKSKAYDSYGLTSDSSTPPKLDLDDNSYIEFAIYSGVSIPSGNPFPNGNPVKLAISFQNEWYYIGAPSGTGAALISMHDFVANGGTGTYDLQLNDTTTTNTVIVTGGITVNFPRFLTSGDLCSFSTLAGMGSITVGSSLTTSDSSHAGTYNTGTPLPGAYFHVTKVDTSVDTIIRQNDLIYLVSGNNAEYLSVATKNGVAYATTSSSPVYCKLDYTEVS